MACVLSWGNWRIVARCKGLTFPRGSCGGPRSSGHISYWIAWFSFLGRIKDVVYTFFIVKSTLLWLTQLGDGSNWRLKPHKRSSGWLLFACYGGKKKRGWKLGLRDRLFFSLAWTCLLLQSLKAIIWHDALLSPQWSLFMGYPETCWCCCLHLCWMLWIGCPTFCHMLLWNVSFNRKSVTKVSFTCELSRMKLLDLLMKFLRFKQS